MADDQDEAQKTEEPSEKKLSDALKRGEVSKSQELKHWFVLFALLLAIMIAGEQSLARLGGMLRSYIAMAGDIRFAGGEIYTIVKGSAIFIASVLLFPIIILIVGALGGSLFQHKLVFTFEKITPKLNKISPLKGLKRLFSLQNFVEFLKSLTKLTIIAAIVVMIVWPEKNRLEQLVYYDLSAIRSLLISLIIRILSGVVIAMSLIAILDYLFQRFEFLKKMRMTKQEVKDEHKQSDGDPHVKAKIRQLRQERARGRMIAEVPSADVIITNPTHYAIAIKYNHGSMEVPKVVAKGVDAVALRIREVADEHHIPMVENPPLARTIFATVDIGDEIQAEQYQAVAEVISYIMRLKKDKLAAYRPKAAVS